MARRRALCPDDVDYFGIQSDVINDWPPTMIDRPFGQCCVQVCVKRCFQEESFDFPVMADHGDGESIGFNDNR